MSLFCARVIKKMQENAPHKSKEDNYDMGVSSFVSILAEVPCIGER